MRSSAILLVLLLALGATIRSDAARQSAARTNFIVILADDQGYGDLGSFGHPTIRTPNLDRMAGEGQRWTSFYGARGGSQYERDWRTAFCFRIRPAVFNRRKSR